MRKELIYVQNTTGIKGQLRAIRMVLWVEELQPSMTTTVSPPNTRGRRRLLTVLCSLIAHVHHGMHMCMHSLFSFKGQIKSVFKVVVSVFCLLKQQGLAMKPWLAWCSKHRPGCPQTLRCSHFCLSVL